MRICVRIFGESMLVQSLNLDRNRLNLDNNRPAAVASAVENTVVRVE